MRLVDMLGGLLGRPSTSGSPIMDGLLPTISGKGRLDGLGGRLGVLAGADTRSMKGLDFAAIVDR